MSYVNVYFKTKKATTEVTAFFQGDGRKKTNGKVSLSPRLSTLNLLQATASTSMAKRPVFGDWEKTKNLLVYTPWSRYY